MLVLRLSSVTLRLAAFSVVFWDDLALLLVGFRVRLRSGELLMDLRDRSMALRDLLWFRWCSICSGLALGSFCSFRLRIRLVRGVILAFAFLSLGVLRLRFLITLSVLRLLCLGCGWQSYS